MCQLRKKFTMEPIAIFSNISLVEMAAYLSTNENEFFVINSIEQRKLTTYENLFLQVINEYKSL